MATSKKTTPAKTGTKKTAKPRKAIAAKAAAVDETVKMPVKETAKTPQAKGSKAVAAPKAAKKAKAKKTTAAKADTKTTPATAKPKGKDKSTGDVSAPIKAIIAAKNNSTPVPAKKTSVATFTMDDVHEVLKNKRDEAREKARKIEAASRKTTVTIKDIPTPSPQQRVLGAATLADILGFGAPSPSKTPEPTHQRDVPEKFKKYYDLLMSLRSKVQGNIHQRGNSDLLGGNIASAVPPQNDDDDSFDHDFALSLVATEQEGLIEIDAAIERIFDGTYGTCEITGKAISPERLDAVPFTRYSVEGQAQFERMHRRRSQRATTFLDSSDDISAFASDDAEE